MNIGRPTNVATVEAPATKEQPFEVLLDFELVQTEITGLKLLSTLMPKQ